MRANLKNVSRNRAAGFRMMWLETRNLWFQHT